MNMIEFICFLKNYVQVHAMFDKKVIDLSLQITWLVSFFDFWPKWSEKYASSLPLTSSTSISHREVVAIALHSLSSPQELFWIWQETMVWEEFVWKNFCCWLLLKDLLHHQPSSLLWFIITRNWNILGSVSDLKIQFFRLSVAIFPTCIYFKTTRTSLWVNFFEI